MVGCELFSGIAKLAASVGGHAAKLGAHVCRNCGVVSVTNTVGSAQKSQSRHMA
jgi:hypothetical protein